MIIKTWDGLFYNLFFIYIQYQGPFTFLMPSNHHDQFKILQPNSVSSSLQTKPAKKIFEPFLQQVVNKIPSDLKISAVPLEFEYLPVELLSKQFTKFNNPHKYRIHYLGPRPINSFILHKKYGSIEYETCKFQPNCSKDFQKYNVNMRRIIQSSFINQGLRTNSHYKNAIFYRAFQGMNPTLNLKDQIIFNSAFESGNLDCVIKPRINTFDIFLRIDSNTRGHTQWFYFSVRNGKKGQKIKLNICNITKGGTLYQQGMKPYIFSRKKKQKLQYDYSWEQGGENVSFEEKPLRYEILYQTIKMRNLYELSFQYKFEQDGDEVFFAYSIPFTYSQLLYKIKSLPSVFVRRQNLGISLTGVEIPLLHLTNFFPQAERKQPKKNILVTGRIHPGESNSSHMMNGLIEFLISNSKQANELRERVNFFIVPMVNPDGVIMGNSRTSAAGKDLNRQFKSHRFELYPQVSLIKNLAYRIKRKYGLYMSLDFHGHSRKKNTFFYGPPYTMSDSQYYKCRVLPRLIQKINSSFRYYGCSFGITEQKRRTGRGVMFEQIKIPYAYTIESSIGLYYNFDEKVTAEFQEKAWSKMGIDIGTGLSQFIVLQQQYEALLKQKVLARQRAKQLKTRDPKQYQQNQINDIDAKTIENQFELKGNIFQGILDEIKDQCSKQQTFEPDVSSDDHDLNQDLEDNKLNEFNNMIVQSIHKEQGLSKNKFFVQDILLQEFPSVQIEQKSQKQLLTELKLSKKQLNSGGIQTRSEKFRNRHIGIKFESMKKRQLTLEKNQQIVSPTKTEDPPRKKKNFVIANKQRYSITAKNFIINDNNRYEVIELPKNIQNIRKQLTKGRILINNLFQSKMTTSKDRETYNFENDVFNWKNQPFNFQHNIGTSRFVRSHLKDKNQNSVMENDAKKFLQRRSSTSHLARKTLAVKQNIKLSPKQKRTIDASEYETFNNFEVDNLAMTIKSFKGI